MIKKIRDNITVCRNRGEGSGWISPPVEAEEYKRLSSNKDRSPQTVLLGKIRDGNYARDIEEQEEGEETVYIGTLVAEGNVMVVEHPSIRLYAEGDMKHAGVLAANMVDKAGFLRFLGIAPPPEDGYMDYNWL